jgi:hypothetical protein
LKNCHYQGQILILGVRAIIRIGAKELAVAAGDGTIDLVEELPLAKAKLQAGNKCPTLQALRSTKSCKISSRITSLKIMNKRTLLIGTAGGDIYTLAIANFTDLTLKSTSHPCSITSIAIPK